MRERWLRAGLVVLAAAGAAVGLWALLAPNSFYEDFPGGRTWVTALPPYNEHLVRDVGSLNLALAVLLVWAAIVLERHLVYAALVAVLINAVPHFLFHVTNMEALSTGDQIGQTVSLGLVVVLPLALLLLTRRTETQRDVVRGQS